MLTKGYPVDYFSWVLGALGVISWFLSIFIQKGKGLLVVFIFGAVVQGPWIYFAFASDNKGFLLASVPTIFGYGFFIDQWRRNRAKLALQWEELYTAYPGLNRRPIVWPAEMMDLIDRGYTPKHAYQLAVVQPRRPFARVVAGIRKI